MAPRLTVPLFCALALIALAPASHAQSTDPPPAPAPIVDKPNAETPPASIDARARALEQSIETDRLRLISLITDRMGKDPALRESPELLAIAERLPRMEEELRLLRNRASAFSASLSATRKDARPSLEEKRRPPTGAPDNRQ